MKRAASGGAVLLSCGKWDEQSWVRGGWYMAGSEVSYMCLPCRVEVAPGLQGARSAGHAWQGRTKQVRVGPLSVAPYVALRASPTTGARRFFVGAWGIVDDGGMRSACDVRRNGVWVWDHAVEGLVRGEPTMALGGTTTTARRTRPRGK